ncbi:SCO2522 family protein [Nocardia huaxiensis]|uniref:SCO2522 family protein n=1 Tax=Nocardia huaxiensis TaxID=2755382 RepID=UPI001E3CEDB0|nr:SCO2522 family protein [Nocardia huaxiensis]UFS94517.1 SCO2522 family protein [Nocardia huaxiensis]
MSAEYREGGEPGRIERQPLSHLSIEVGHFFMREVKNGTVRAELIRAQFKQVAPLVKALTEMENGKHTGRARISTCFLVDDYFGSDADPTEVLDTLLEIADECSVRIDYLAREAGCAEVPAYIGAEPTGTPLQLAEMMRARLIAEPDVASNGRRPPASASGWLANGRRSSEYEPGQAMRVEPYRPPEEYGARNHSIFMDVQLWSDEPGDAGHSERVLWSCPYLASIWQLLRLGMIRHNGKVVAEPRSRPARWPSDWSAIPAVVKLEPAADPFAAYQAMSILPHSYLGIEHAVRVTLNHFWLDDQVYTQIKEQASGEGIEIPHVVTRRLSHLFIGDM